MGINQDNYKRTNNDFLLDDHKKDPDYTKGNVISGGWLVGGTLSDFKNILLGILDYQGVNGNFMHDGCHIILTASRDNQIPNNPLCFGRIIVEGIRENVERVNQLLFDNIPELSK